MNEEMLRLANIEFPEVIDASGVESLMESWIKNGDYEVRIGIRQEKKGGYLIAPSDEAERERLRRFQQRGKEISGVVSTMKCLGGIVFQLNHPTRWDVVLDEVYQHGGAAAQLEAMRNIDELTMRRYSGIEFELIPGIDEPDEMPTGYMDLLRDLNRLTDEYFSTVYQSPVPDTGPRSALSDHPWAEGKP